MTYNDSASIRGAKHSAALLLAAVDRLTGRGPQDEDQPSGLTASQAIDPELEEPEEEEE